MSFCDFLLIIFVLVKLPCYCTKCNQMRLPHGDREATPFSFTEYINHHAIATVFTGDECSDYG